MSMSVFFLFFLGGLVFLGAAMLVWWRVSRVRKRLHMPSGKWQYSDLHVPAKPLFSRRYMLTGKPDGIVEVNGRVQVVEYKSGWYEHLVWHHVMQLGVYCMLVEDVRGCRVDGGWVVYPSGRFWVRFDGRLREEVMQVLGEMRRVLRGESVVKTVVGAQGKCERCSFNSVCPSVGQ